MKKLLIVDDDEALRGMLRRRLLGVYSVFDTGEPEQALALALEHKPDAILLDLRMPKFDGFELCRNFRSISYTSNLPIFVITGESGSHKKECEAMGAAGYFEKPIDFAKLKEVLAATLKGTEPQSRETAPLRIRVGLKLQGTDSRGEPFTELVSTESANPQGFQFNSTREFGTGSIVDVFLTGSTEHHVGHARITERSSAGLQLQAYSAVLDAPQGWILQNTERIATGV